MKILIEMFTDRKVYLCFILYIYSVNLPKKSLVFGHLVAYWRHKIFN